ncbi:hypothetical protein AURDEDRAFT_183535 [Auricularia subglabra TFB-10046 SS5]|nr:hypothetical protein AURDEDRAFT_183535 [Auricularia subglabra TFB-10046 SS5]
MTAASIDYNVAKWTLGLLEKHKGDEPSFSVHFYEAHWSINNSATSQFLYGSAISSILDDIRACRIPTDFLDLFDKSGVQFFEGCLIVALHDHRIRVKANGSNAAADAGPDPQRVVLQPTAETLYADIKSLAEADRLQGRPWTDEQALEFESEVLLATSQPLCLDPDINATRIANRLLRASTPVVPRSLKRKRGEGPDESGDDEFQKLQRAKLMQFMNPRSGRTFNSRLSDNRIDFTMVRDVLAQMAGKPPGLPSAQQAPRQATPLAINTGVARAVSASSAKSSVAGRLDDKKKAGMSTNLNAVIMKKGLGGKGAEDSPASASKSLPSASEDRPKVILKLPSTIKKDDSTQRVSTPVTAQQPAMPGRVSTPLQQPARTQTPVISQTPQMNAQPAVAHAAPPPPQTTGLTFQAGQLPEQFLRGPPVPKNANVAGMPQMAAGKRPQTPQQQTAMMLAAGKGTVPSQPAQTGRPPGAALVAGHAVPVYNPNNPAHATYMMQNRLTQAAAVAAGRGIAIPANRFSGALQMGSRPGAPGVVAMPPNPLVAGSGGDQPQANPQWTAAQVQQAIMAAAAAAQQQQQHPQQGARVALTPAQAAAAVAYNQQYLHGVATGRISSQGLTPQQVQQVQMMRVYLAQRPAPPGAPKPPGAR